MDFEAPKEQHGEDAVKEAFMLGVVQGLKQAQEWIPIKKAPKNEDLFLGYVPHSGGGYICGFYWNKEIKQWQNNIDGGCDRPTHWMPLPASPQERLK